MNRNIIWLASYPKSGNTWLRAFLANYISRAEKPLDINSHFLAPMISARHILEEYGGIELSDVPPALLPLYRSRIHLQISQSTSERLLFKVHDAQVAIPTEPTEFLFPALATQGAIYVVRNPFDVTVSFAHHNHINTETAVYLLHRSADASSLFKGDISNQLPYEGTSWRDNVLSWVDHTQFPVCVVRYEDMVFEPLATFRRIITFMEGTVDDAVLERAIRHTQFDVLKQQEAEKGFNESPSAERPFFRRGKVGAWREELSNEHAQTIIERNRDVLQRFGYVNDDDTPVYG